MGFQPGDMGEVILSGRAAALLDRWIAYLTRLLQRYYTEALRAPLFLTRETLETAGYLQHFPQQVLLTSNAADPDGPGRCLTPAACFHVYPRMTGQAIENDPTGILIEARCARHEGGDWVFPFRNSSFHMLELVLFGSLASLEAARDEVRPMLSSALAGAGIQGIWRPATDAFFLGNDDGARLIQKLKELKLEYTVDCAGQPLALASINSHEEYFGKRFDIRAAGSAAHSCCIAFGLERLTAYSLLQWGDDPAAWPREFHG